MENDEIKGTVNGVRYSIDASLAARLKAVHNIDAIKEIEEALKKEAKNESNSTEGQSSSN